jgi:hypothetical protein
MANGRTRKWENSEEGKAWQKEYQDKSPETRIRLRKDSGIPAALEKASADAGIPAIEYLRLAVAERLEAEGYETGYKAEK